MSTPDGLFATFAIAYVAKSYLPASLTILLTPVRGALMLDAAFLIAYGYSFTMCTRLAFNSAFMPPFSGLPVVSIPQCIFDDMYHFFDTLVFPRHIDWGSKLFPRDDNYVIHPRVVTARLESAASRCA